MHTPSFAEFKKAIKSGFQEKALSILKADERYFTKAEIKEVYEYGKTNGAILKYLLELSIDRDMIDVSENEDELIRDASRNGHKEVVELLLARDSRYRCVDPSTHGNYAIQWASQNGHKEVVKLLLARDDVDPSAGNNSAINCATVYNQPQVVKILLAHGDSVVRNNRAIDLACCYDRVEVIKLLLTRDDIDPSANNNHAIRWASENGNMKTVELMLADSRVRAKGVPQKIINKCGKF